MICPKCGSEYVDGIFECADCLVKLIPAEDYVREDDLEISLDDWKEIFSTVDPIEIEMVKANLKGAGIESVSLSKVDRTKLSVFYTGSASIKLYVKEENVETAKQIIDDINKTEAKDEE
jgi:hypothetical protein